MLTKYLSLYANEVQLTDYIRVTMWFMGPRYEFFFKNDDMLC